MPFNISYRIPDSSLALVILILILLLPGKVYLKFIFLAIFASLCSKLHYLCFIIAFCFFIGINEDLGQSIVEVRKLVSRKGFCETITRLLRR